MSATQDMGPARYYQLTIADNYIEIRDFTNNARVLDLNAETAEDVRRLLNFAAGVPGCNGITIDEKVE